MSLTFPEVNNNHGTKRRGVTETDLLKKKQGHIGFEKKSISRVDSERKICRRKIEF